MAVQARFLLGIVAPCLQLALSALPASAQAPDAPAAMILLDGSGSMWARLDGDSKQAKFYLARDAIKGGLPTFKSEFRLGFASFGHRRQGDCSDVQVSMPPEDEGGRERLSNLLDRHNPRGKSPLAAALKEAAKALPKGSGPRSLIVVHDDLDNCGQDPCAALADLRAAQPNLVVHAIGLGLKGDDAQRLQCLVKPTGGRLIDVQAASAVATATEEVFKLAAAGPVLPSTAAGAAQASKQAPSAAVVAPAATRPQTAAVQPGQRRPLRKDGPPALRLAALLVAGQPPLARDVAWVIRSADNPAEPLHVVGQDVSVPLTAGAYLVDMSDGVLPARTLQVAVAAQGETALDVTLDAALVRAGFAAAPSAGGRVQLFAGDLSRPVGIQAASALARGIAIAPGPWIARLSDGIASRDIPFEARVGATIDLGANWPFAALAVTVAGDVKDAAHPPTVIVYEDDPDAPRGRREVARGVAGAVLVVPAGAYAVVVRQGHVEARDRVALAAGARIERTIALTTARLNLTSRLPGAGASADADEPVAYRLERIDVVPPEVFTSNRRVADLALPAGRYRVEARHGLINARATRDVVLVAGQAQALTLEPQAGLLRLVGPAGVTDLLWELRDDSGHPLWSTAQTAPVATLQAGRYTVRLESRGRRQEWRLDLRPGEIKQLDAKL